VNAYTHLAVDLLISLVGFYKAASIEYKKLYEPPLIETYHEAAMESSPYSLQLPNLQWFLTFLQWFL